MYIAIGIGIAVVTVLLLVIDKFAPFSEFMGGFKKGTFPKFIIGLSTAAVLCIGYGIYYELTYQPPYLDIQVDGSNHTVFGDIGEIGYYADGLVTKGEENTVYLVSWANLNLSGNTSITIEYPSAKEETWTPTVSPVDGISKNLKDEYGIKEIYQLEPYTFEESGVIELTINDEEFSIEVN
ncbi:hypothetical protein [Virgibacillus doumboii]|uniref:hypothetical protein n=1 Tax=Virgibacillus doumboii TaxID=2697503 RepID=UPI0013DEA87B|nr:hypothetical protein [Virgibacillus doumboii]